MTTNGTARIYRPAAMSVTCGEFDRNPDWETEICAPYLLRCNERATYQIVIRTDVSTEVKKCCGYHAAQIRHQAHRGRFEIVSDEPIEERITA